MRCAIIGDSGHFGYLLEALRLRTSGDELCAVAPGPQGGLGRLAQAAEKAGHAPKVYEDFRAMLDRERPDLVAVDPWFCDIAPVTMEALVRGIAVFSEKPLATDWGQLMRLRQTLEDHPGKLCAMFGIRGHAAFQAAKDAAPRLGDIRLAHGQKSYKLGTRGPVYQLRERSGGLMPWVGIHAMDWIYWITGKRYEKAYGGHSRIGNGGNGELEASAASLFVLEGETLATVTADFLRPAAAPRHDDDQLRLTGTKGTLFVRNGEAFLEPMDGPMEKLPLPPERSVCADFMAELEGGPSCGLTAADALHVTAVALAARDAADKGIAVSVPKY